jgi:hypothetical protein
MEAGWVIEMQNGDAHLFCIARATVTKHGCLAQGCRRRLGAQRGVEMPWRGVVAWAMVGQVTWVMMMMGVRAAPVKGDASR